MIRVFTHLLILTLFLNISATVPSKFVSRTGHVHVESHSRFIDVIADNYQVYCEFVPASGKVLIRGLTKSFEFKMGALDRAFNSDRVNMNEFSKFRYDGTVSNLSQIDFTRRGRYPVEVKGTLYVGNFKRITNATGQLYVQDDGTIRVDTSFGIRIEEESVQTINRLMKEKLPSLISLDADKLGISRDIQLELKANFRPRS